MLTLVTDSHLNGSQDLDYKIGVLEIFSGLRVPTKALWFLWTLSTMFTYLSGLSHLSYNYH